MKVNTEKKLVHPKTGEKLKEGDLEITLGSFISDVLLYDRQNQARSWLLARKLMKDKITDIKAEDIAFIKEVLNRSGLPALSVGQAIDMIEDNDTELVPAPEEAPEKPTKKKV
jgi:hypothetical protein